MRESDLNTMVVSASASASVSMRVEGVRREMSLKALYNFFVINHSIYEYTLLRFFGSFTRFAVDD